MPSRLKNEKIAETDAREETRSSPSVVEPRELEAPPLPPSQKTQSHLTPSPPILRLSARYWPRRESIRRLFRVRVKTVVLPKRMFWQPPKNELPPLRLHRHLPRLIHSLLLLQAPASKSMDGAPAVLCPLIRRKIASRLVEAQQNAAILSTFNEVDLSAVMALRKRHQDSFVKHNGVKLGFMSFSSRQSFMACRRFPA